MIIALLVLIAVGVVFIALQTRREVARAFCWHLLQW
jgi:hypothetical protein